MHAHTHRPQSLILVLTSLCTNKKRCTHPHTHWHAHTQHTHVHHSTHSCPWQPTVYALGTCETQLDGRHIRAWHIRCTTQIVHNPSAVYDVRMMCMMCVWRKRCMLRMACAWCAYDAMRWFKLNDQTTSIHSKKTHSSTYDGAQQHCWLDIRSQDSCR
jgi:hypothetical protein